MKPKTPEEMAVAIEEVKRNLASPEFWARVEESKRAVAELHRKSRVDVRKLHEPIDWVDTSFKHHNGNH